MKIIISHDIDHIDYRDHFFRDLTIPKFWIRSLLHVFQNRITIKTFFCRILVVFRGRQNRVEEIMAFDKEHGIQSTFFVGVNNGLGLSYNYNKASIMIERILKEGFDVGVHGITYDEAEGIKKEWDKFFDVTKSTDFGIRMHYVRQSEDTLKHLSECGYSFDSTCFDKAGISYANPYRIGSMYEFPLGIMDVYIQTIGDSEKSREDTIKVIEKAKLAGVNYLTVLFHDSYYDESIFPQEKKWYEWLVDYLEKEGYEFSSFKTAIKEMEKEYG